MDFLWSPLLMCLLQGKGRVAVLGMLSKPVK
jgi:hypothetical protein